MRTENPSFLTPEETGRIVRRISPQFAKYVQKFDERRFPREIYEGLIRYFAKPKGAAEHLRAAMVWKYGRVQTDKITEAQERLAAELRKNWRDLNFSRSAEQLFSELQSLLKRKTTFITLAFLTHLVKPVESPIIDQHNFRAMNHLLREVRPKWPFKRAPSRFSDVVMLHSFMKQLTKNWRSIVSTATPSSRELDKFLMMYGKELKVRKPSRKSKAKSQSDRATVTSDLIGDPDNRGTEALIRLPFGGANRSFAVSKLVRHIQGSKYDFIIQGQTNCTFSQHRKPNSLDFWLRQNFAENPDTRQAVNKVVEQLISTGLFERRSFLCPDSKRKCAGIRLVA